MRAPPVQTPPLSAVMAVVDALRAQGAVAAVGGSGLLAALGLIDRVRTRIWRGLPIADPEVWLQAYRLLGRQDRADLLQHWYQAGRPLQPDQ